ncbi:hypothetical protein E4U41_005741, partial [Claviceps citrina]
MCVQPPDENSCPKSIDARRNARRKLAPFGFFRFRARPVHAHSRHGRTILRYLFPRAIRDRYRERLLDFQLDTLPLVKHRLQSGLYRFLAHRPRTRAERSSRILDLVARQSRRIPPNVKASPRDALNNPSPSKMPPYAGFSPNYGHDANHVQQQDACERGERGFRRRRLAAMAGSLYRSGQQAVTDLRDSYMQSRGIRGVDDSGANESMHIPGAFPDVAITSRGNEQMVLFPSYGKRHTKGDWTRGARTQALSEQPEQRDEEWWRQEWERHEDERAVVDVDVRGWTYSPHVGPMTRRNRILIGLARQLSGISAPKTTTDPASASNAGGGGDPGRGGNAGEQEKIAEEAAVIEERGQEEKRVASAGGYSEQQPGERSGNKLGFDAAAVPPRQRQGRRRGGSRTPDSAPTSPSLSARRPSGAGELTEAELVVANANLMARVAPFLTNPLVARPVTLFFYNESDSVSKTVLTDDAGHFNVRAALRFIPTHVRVLAAGNETLSATHEIHITEPSGVSLISDIDDTVKRSNIAGGAREIFRNTFVRDLGQLCVEGVREWYADMHDMGVSMHYCSNSPWQLYPVLATFFKVAGLPPGSLHLKQYSGMLQGIFEPVAERKKTTLARLVRDFPGRKFLLVGDSGEADLEVYTELALANPGRVLGIFIRDVTTPEATAATTGYFDPAFDFCRRKVSSMTLDDGKASSSSSSPSSSGGYGRPRPSPSGLRQNSAPGAGAREKPATGPGPVMGTLIDFAAEPDEVELDASAALAQIKQQQQQRSAAPGPRPAPPRPAKPAALRSAPA